MYEMMGMALEAKRKTQDTNSPASDEQKVTAEVSA